MFYQCDFLWWPYKWKLNFLDESVIYGHIEDKCLSIINETELRKKEVKFRGVDL